MTAKKPKVGDTVTFVTRGDLKFLDRVPEGDIKPFVGKVIFLSKKDKDSLLVIVEDTEDDAERVYNISFDCIREAAK